MSQEEQYLDLVKKILETGHKRLDRTGVGTLSLFGETMRFDLSQSFPLITTKKVFWRGIVEELLWMLSGSTDVTLLSKKNVHIWDGNTSRSALDKLGLHHLQEGDLGPGYGFQWRHYGAKYIDCKTDYTGQGVDQIAEAIKLIKTDPYSRRIIVNTWNPCEIKTVALPPCHMYFSFYVIDNKLCCHIHLRSNDMILGAPFNIASYALLTYMIAHICGLTPGELFYTIADAHIYLNHLDGVTEQLKREPYPLPQLRIKRTITDINDFKYEDFELVGYQSHGPIKLEMAV